MKQKQYCYDCLDVFDPKDLDFCICSLGGGTWEQRVVTKYGVRYEKIQQKYCKKCLETKHGHEGEIYI